MESKTPEISSHAVWLWHRFSLRFHDTEDLQAQRGVSVTYTRPVGSDGGVPRAGHGNVRLNERGPSASRAGSSSDLEIKPLQQLRQSLPRDPQRQGGLCPPGHRPVPVRR